MAEPNNTYISYLNYLNTDDLVFNMGFGIGIIKYTISEKERDDELPQPFGAVSYGLLNSIRTSIIAAFVPPKMRILIPLLDASYSIYRIFVRKRVIKRRTIGPTCPDYDIESQHTHSD